MKAMRNEDILSIYEKDIPVFLVEAHLSPAMKRIEHVGMHCGMEYTSFPIYKDLAPYSRGFHSLGVALITYHFTKDRKQALAGLFHDIATPCFSHVIDFLHHDYKTQESTEKKTTSIIRNDSLIPVLLKQYQLSIEDVDNYHLYPIADNDSPRLSADRLEYTLSNFLNFSLTDYDTVRKFYDNLTITKNEEGEDELAFLDEDIALEFTLLTLKTSRYYISDEDRFGMEILSRILKAAIDRNTITEDDLYTEEPLLLEKLKNDSLFVSDFNRFRSMDHILVSDTEKEGYFKVASKKRYINPLVINRGRIKGISTSAEKAINEYLSFSFERYLSIEDIDSFSFN